MLFDESSSENSLSRSVIKMEPVFVLASSLILFRSEMSQSSWPGGVGGITQLKIKKSQAQH